LPPSRGHVRRRAAYRTPPHGPSKYLLHLGELPTMPKLILAAVLLVSQSQGYAPPASARRGLRLSTSGHSSPLLRTSSTVSPKLPVLMVADPDRKQPEDQHNTVMNRPSRSNSIFPAKKAAFVAALVACLLATSHPDAANAAVRSGGRLGGRTSVSRSRSSTAARSYSSPRMGSSVNIHVAPPTLSPYGYGGYGGGIMGGPQMYRPYGYGGGMLMSPGYYGGGPSAPMIGLSLLELLVREQQRQAFIQQQLAQQRELGRDKALIDQLQAELDKQNTVIEQLQQQQRQQQAGAGAATPQSPATPGTSPLPQ